MAVDAWASCILMLGHMCTYSRWTVNIYCLVGSLAAIFMANRDSLDAAGIQINLRASKRITVVHHSEDVGVGAWYHLQANIEGTAWNIGFVNKTSYQRKRIGGQVGETARSCPWACADIVFINR